MLGVIGLAAKGLIVLAIALAVITLLQRRSAGTRYLVWSTAICSLLLLPLLAFVVPAHELPLVPGAWFPEDAVAAATSPVPRFPAAITPRPTPRAPVVAPQPQQLAARPGRDGGGARQSPAPARETDLQALSSSLQGPALREWFALPAWPSLLAGLYVLGVLGMLAHCAIGVRRVMQLRHDRVCVQS